jgi:hypothetical protein
VKTNGWIGFGFSPNGGMDRSDIIVGWISNGVPHFTVLAYRTNLIIKNLKKS